MSSVEPQQDVEIGRCPTCHAILVNLSRQYASCPNSGLGQHMKLRQRIPGNLLKMLRTGEPYATCVEDTTYSYAFALSDRAGVWTLGFVRSKDSVAGWWPVGGYEWRRSHFIPVTLEDKTIDLK